MSTPYEEIQARYAEQADADRTRQGPGLTARWAAVWDALEARKAEWIRPDPHRKDHEPEAWLSGAGRGLPLSAHLRLEAWELLLGLLPQPGDESGELTTTEYQAVALAWASDALQFLQEDAAAYRRYRDWQLACPDREPGEMLLTPRNLRGAEMIVLLVSMRLFGSASLDRIAALSQPGDGQNGETP